jgi:hypothetical protein
MLARSALARAIEQLLMEHWDPVGVQGMADATDEYDAYADLLARQQWDSPAEIAEMLVSIETNNMDLAANPQRAEAAASHIFALIREGDGAGR